MRDEERIVQRLLELATGARLIYHQSQSRGEPDFDLRRADGGIEPVEVTRSTDQQLQQQYARITRGPRNQGHLVPRTKTSHDWAISPFTDADIRRIREGIDEYIRDIEADGLSSFFFSTHAAKYRSVDRIGRELKVEAGSVASWKVPGIQIEFPVTGGTILADHIVAAVEREARKPDNVRKLRREAALHRHLVVVLDPLDDQSGDPDAQPLGAMQHGLMPDRPPVLPPEVTDVWVIGSDYSPGRYRIFHATPTCWQDLGYMGIE